jgi:hypothetical protein
MFLDVLDANFGNLERSRKKHRVSNNFVGEIWDGPEENLMSVFSVVSVNSKLIGRE